MNSIIWYNLPMIPQFDKIEESRGPCNTFIGKVLNSWLPSPGCKALLHEETTQTHGCIPTIPVSLKLTELLCSVFNRKYIQTLRRSALKTSRTIHICPIVPCRFRVRPVSNSSSMLQRILIEFSHFALAPQKHATHASQWISGERDQNLNFRWWGMP